MYMIIRRLYQHHMNHFSPTILCHINTITVLSKSIWELYNECQFITQKQSESTCNPSAKQELSTILLKANYCVPATNCEFPPSLERSNVARTNHNSLWFLFKDSYHQVPTRIEIFRNSKLMGKCVHSGRKPFHIGCKVFTINRKLDKHQEQTHFLNLRTPDCCINW